MILMQGDFFQVLRRVQKEERNKSSLARVDNDFYKHLRDYIKDLERSVAMDPFGNEQLLLNNAQRIATEICELRESKITKAANNNIYRSFLLFKKDNPQFDLLDTTPLNLTDEEETLYFSLMDALKNHRYRISLDEYTDESREGEEEDFDEDFDEDDETTFVEDSYEESVTESGSDVSDELEDEISEALGESDEVLSRLNQIKDAKVVTDEKYEHIDKQVASQRYSGQGTVGSIEEAPDDVQESAQEAIEEPEQEIQDSPQDEVQESGEDIQSTTEDSSKPKGFGTSNINDIFKDPDSQFVDLDNLEPDYDDDYYNRIAAGSNYAPPSEDDFNMLFAKPKKPKADEESLEESQSAKEDDLEIPQSANEVKSESPQLTDEVKSEIPQSAEEKSESSYSSQAELGFSSGLDVKESKSGHTDAFDKAVEKSEEDNAPKKVVDKTKGGLFTREEIENTTVVIKENVGEMIGIDGKVYGPFLENDIVILPNITAQILIDNDKASLVKL